MPSSSAEFTEERFPGRWTARFLHHFIMIFAVAALWLSLFAFFERKIEVRTGDAAWIWADHPLASREPLAFAAVREFVPPAERASAHVLVAAHPEYAIYLNGARIGAAGAGREARLDRYEVSGRLREGTNRLVVVARSRDGVGGVLVTMDYGPDRRNALVTPDGWRVSRDLRAAFTVPLAELEEPRVLGRPPFGAWNVPELQPRITATADNVPVAPAAITDTKLVLPEIAVLSGVAVIRERRLDARVFDFGPVRGRLRFERRDPSSVLVVPWRTANAANEIGLEATPASAVFGAGETTYIAPAEESFRYVIVYDPGIEVTVHPF